MENKITYYRELSENELNLCKIALEEFVGTYGEKAGKNIFEKMKNLLKRLETEEFLVK